MKQKEMFVSFPGHARLIPTETQRFRPTRIPKIRALVAMRNHGKRACVLACVPKPFLMRTHLYSTGVRHSKGRP